MMTMPGNSALSSPALIFTGTIITGGTGTTNTPHVLIQPTAATGASNWSGSGTAFAIHVPAGFTGNVCDFRINGNTSLLQLLSSGTMVILGNVEVGASNGFRAAGRSKFSSTADGKVSLTTNNGTTSGIIFDFTGTTTKVTLRNLADSADGTFQCNDLILSKTVTPAGTTGAQTINKASGTVNFAALATTLVLTNSLITTSSIVQLTLGTNDTTCRGFYYSPGAGSITIRTNGTPAAECRCDFLITN